MAEFQRKYAKLFDQNSLIEGSNIMTPQPLKYFDNNFSKGLRYMNDGVRTQLGEYQRQPSHKLKREAHLRSVLEGPSNPLLVPNGYKNQNRQKNGGLRLTDLTKLDNITDNNSRFWTRNYLSKFSPRDAVARNVNNSIDFAGER